MWVSIAECGFHQQDMAVGSKWTAHCGNVVRNVKQALVFFFFKPPYRTKVADASRFVRSSASFGTLFKRELCGSAGH